MAANASSVNVGTYTLPELPYAYDALEPAISTQIMTLHHTKHHQTYTTNLNALLLQLSTALRTNDIAAQIALQPGLKFNAGGYINHVLFFENLAPTGTPETKVEQSAPKLKAAIEEAFGSVESFISSFKKTLLGIQGSGWGWLVRVSVAGGKESLRIVTTKDQDPIVGEGEVPILGVDMWEHAYYLQYLNGKAGYVDNIWSVVNWKVAEQRFVGGGREDVFKALKASI